MHFYKNNIYYLKEKRNFYNRVKKKYINKKKFHDETTVHMFLCKLH
jgi:hypothetical protein